MLNWLRLHKDGIGEKVIAGLLIALVLGIVSLVPWTGILDFVVQQLVPISSRFADTVASIAHLIGRLLNASIPLYSILIVIPSLVIAGRIYTAFRLRDSQLRILEAKYGANGRFVDITNQLNAEIRDNTLRIVISNNIAGDPLPRALKTASIRYRYQGKVITTTCEEYRTLSLPL